MTFRLRSGNKGLELRLHELEATIMDVHAKGLLGRVRDGKRYLYSPKLTREQFLESTAREVLEGAVGGQRALAMLAEKVAQASARELDELEALIRQRREALQSE